jgi:hypothetical protein
MTIPGILHLGARDFTKNLVHNEGGSFIAPCGARYPSGAVFARSGGNRQEMAPTHFSATTSSQFRTIVITEADKRIAGLAQGTAGQHPIKSAPHYQVGDLYFA